LSVVLNATYRLSLDFTSIGTGLGFWVVITVLAGLAILYGLTFLGLTVMVSSVINDLISLQNQTYPCLRIRLDLLTIFTKSFRMVAKEVCGFG